MSLEYIEILYRASHSSCGLVVETSDAERLRQRLYPLRKENPDFEPLAFVISPFNGKDLWILNKGNVDEG